MIKTGQEETTFISVNATEVMNSVPPAEIHYDKGLEGTIPQPTELANKDIFIEGDLQSEVKEELLAQVNLNIPNNLQSQVTKISISNGADGISVIKTDMGYEVTVPYSKEYVDMKFSIYKAFGTIFRNTATASDNWLQYMETRNNSHYNRGPFRDSSNKYLTACELIATGEDKTTGQDKQTAISMYPQLATSFHESDSKLKQLGIDPYADFTQHDLAVAGLKGLYAEDFDIAFAKTIQILAEAKDKTKQIEDKVAFSTRFHYICDLLMLNMDKKQLARFMLNYIETLNK